MNEYHFSSHNFQIPFEDRFLVYNSLMGKVLNSPYSMSTDSNINNLGLTCAAKKRLLEWGFIVDVDTPEMNQFMFMRDQLLYDNILSICIYVTNKCNFNCVYCYQNHTPVTISAETLSNLYIYIKKNISRFRAIQISVFGGEPFDEPAVVLGLLKDIQSISKKAHKPFSCRITTNGYNIDDYVIKQLTLLNCLEVQITIDGSPIWHNKYRVTQHGEPTFDKIYSNLKRIASYGIHVTLRINTTKDNLSELSEFLLYLDSDIPESNRVSFYLYPVQDWGGNISSLMELTDRSTEILETVYSNLSSISFDLSPYSSPGGLICFGYYRHSFMLLPNGNMVKCSINTNEAFASLVEEGRIMNLNYINSRSALSEIRNECRRCPLLGMCYGLSCSHKDSIHIKCSTHLKNLPLILRIADHQGKSTKLEELL